MEKEKLTNIVQILIILLFVLAIRDSINNPESFIMGVSDALNLFK